MDESFDHEAFDQALATVQALDPISQIMIADQVTASYLRDENYESAWAQEIKERIDAYKRGENSLVPIEEAHDRIIAMIEEARSNEK